MPADAAQKFVWQRLSDPAEIDYDSSAARRDNLVPLLSFEPRFALDIGCAAGGGARVVKEAFPSCVLWGIEPDARAAEAASACMDRVITGSFESVDWAAQGVIAGAVDTVFLLDVLEHMYDPWRTLAKLRSFVSRDAQLVISLPNVRNMFIIRDLMNGYWHYRDFGLLDATHIRFFTEYEALRLIYQTGFRVERRSFTMCAGVGPIYEKIKDQPFPQTLKFEKGSLVVDNLAELQSFSVLQHLFLIRPAARDSLNAGELVLAQGPHPATFAMGANLPGVV